MPGARDGTGQQEGLPEEAGLRASAFKSALWLSRRPSAQHNTHTVTLTSPFHSWGRGPASYLRKALHSCAKVWFSIGLRLHSFSLEIQPAWCRGSRERICSSVTKSTSSSISLIPALLLEHPHARHAGGTKQPTATCS